MTRPLLEVEIDGKKFNAVLDTGSRRSYIRADLARDFPSAPVEPFEVRLGGQRLTLKEGKLVSGIVRDSEGRGYRFSQILFPVEDLGEENGKRIDILFGAITLEDWGTVIDESSKPPKIDHRLLRKGELVELVGNKPNPGEIAKFCIASKVFSGGGEPET
jgi:hypothetical protein